MWFDDETSSGVNITAFTVGRQCRQGQPVGERPHIVELRLDGHTSRAVDEAVFENGIIIRLILNLDGGKSVGELLEVADFVTQSGYRVSFFVNNTETVVVHDGRQAFGKSDDETELRGNNHIAVAVDESVLIVDNYRCQPFGKATSVLIYGFDDNVAALVDIAPTIFDIYRSEAIVEKPSST